MLPTPAVFARATPATVSRLRLRPCCSPLSAGPSTHPLRQSKREQTRYPPYRAVSPISVPSADALAPERYYPLDLHASARRLQPIRRIHSLCSRHKEPLASRSYPFIPPDILPSRLKPLTFLSIPTAHSLLSRLTNRFTSPSLFAALSALPLASTNSPIHAVGPVESIFIPTSPPPDPSPIFDALASVLMSSPFATGTTIIVLTIVLRTCLTLPIAFWQRKRYARTRKYVLPAMKETNDRLAQELIPVCRRKGLDYDGYKKELKRQVS